MSSPSSWSLFTTIHGLSSSITEKQYKSGWDNKGYESNKKVLSKEKLLCLKIQGQIPLLISVVKLYWKSVGIQCQNRRKCTLINWLWSVWCAISVPPSFSNTITQHFLKLSNLLRPIVLLQQWLPVRIQHNVSIHKILFYTIKVYM